MQSRPIDAQFRIDYTYYKIGRFNLVFIWLNGYWKRSTKSISDLKKPRRITGDTRRRCV